MDKKVQNTQFTNGMRPGPQAPHTPAPQSYSSRGRNNKKLLWIVGTLILLAAILTAVFFYSSRSQVDSSKYQAVFLTNGQVYFGKLNDYYTERPYVTDVYYIQAPNGTSTENAEAPSDNANQQLVKLGSEVHAPENKIILNKQSILFVENLTSEGKVMELIEESKKSDK